MFKTFELNFILWRLLENHVAIHEDGLFQQDVMQLKGNQISHQNGPLLRLFSSTATKA